MIKQRDLIVILVCLAVIIAAVWFWVYYQPASNRIEQLEARTEERREDLRVAEQQARQREVGYANLSAEYAEIKEAWEVAAADLPVRFKDTEVLRHIQSVVYPHTENLNLSFSNSVQRADDELWSTTINLNFETSYWQLLSILDTLVHGDLGNRVINYSLNVSPLAPAVFLSLVERSLEHIPYHIVQQFNRQIYEYFVLGLEDAEIWGLYMLNVTMDIEYLSLEPGIVPLATLREQWEAEVAAAEGASTNDE